MNLIDRIKELQKLEAKAALGECIAIEDDDRSGDFLIIQNKEHWAWKDGSNSIDAKYIASLRNAAPELLSILGESRPGDDELLALMILNNQQRWTDENWQKAIDCLRRYQAMAERMEASK